MTLKNSGLDPTVKSVADTSSLPTGNPTNPPGSGAVPVVTVGTNTDYKPFIFAAVGAAIGYLWKKDVKWAIGGAVAGYAGNKVANSSSSL